VGVGIFFSIERWARGEEKSTRGGRIDGIDSRRGILQLDLTAVKKKRRHVPKQAAEKLGDKVKLTDSVPPRLNRLRKKAEIVLKSPKSIPPRLKPNSFYGLYMGVKTPISLRIEFFRSL
jgi:hypothetical protein